MPASRRAIPRKKWGHLLTLLWIYATFLLSLNTLALLVAPPTLLSGTFSRASLLLSLFMHLPILAFLLLVGKRNFAKSTKS